MAGTWTLKIGEETKTVDWPPGEDSDQARVTIAGVEYRVRYQALDDHHFHLLVDGRSIQVFVAPGEPASHVFIDGAEYRVRPEDPAPSRKNRVRSEETSGEVTPPMPAVVVRILVREGEEVSRGQGLVVVSAMKMETTLKAPYDGTVRKIQTSLQAKVMPGERLVEIEGRE